MSSTNPDLARTRTPGRGQNRQSAPRMNLFKIPVNVPPAVAQFRAEYSAYARWLPPHLASVLIGAICTADAGGDDAVTTFEAISAATHTPGIQKRYKCKPVSPMQVERNMPLLRELGVLTWHSEKTRVTGWSDDYGQVRARIYLRLTIENIDRLYELAGKEQHKKAVRDADRAARREDYEQARNERRKIDRARKTVVTCEDAEGNNSCPTPDAGSSAGSEAGSNAGSNAGRIVPTRSCVAGPDVPAPTYPPSTTAGCARDGGDDKASSNQNPQDDLDDRAWLADFLGFSAEQAAVVGWNAVELARDLAVEYGWNLVGSAAILCSRQHNPPGYFIASARNLCAQAAVRMAAEAEKQRQRLEREAAERAAREQAIIENRIAQFREKARAKRLREEARAEANAEAEIRLAEAWPAYVAEVHGGDEAAAEASVAAEGGPVDRVKRVENRLRRLREDREDATREAAFEAAEAARASLEPRVVDLLRSGPMSMRDLAAALGLDSFDPTLKTAMFSLMAQRRVATRDGKWSLVA